MNERVVEILVYLMSEIQNNKGNIDQIDTISQELINKGYTENEINIAFSWLFEKMQSETEEVLENTELVSEESFRVLHDTEKMVISPKAHGYLLQLKNWGLIDTVGMEQVIERATMLGRGPITENEIKSIVAALLSNSEDKTLQTLNKTMTDQNSLIH
ncbi:DUF494 family protein [bacterium]|nr:DUF494 family protein [bacterium]